jgi:hypothetical protein
MPIESVEMSKDGKKATIVLDLTGEGAESSSGKTLILASTGGNQPVGEMTAGPYKGRKLVLGLNCYVYKNPK